MTYELNTVEGYALITVGDLYRKLEAGEDWEMQGEYMPHPATQEQLGRIPAGVLVAARQRQRPAVTSTLPAKDVELIRDGAFRLEESSDQPTRYVLGRLREACGWKQR